MVDDASDLKTLQYAQNLAFLLHARSPDPLLAGSHALRFYELRRDAGPLLPRQEGTPQACRRCGTLVVPGWTGQMRLQRENPGRRSKGKGKEVLGRNKLQWRCSCGWQLRSTGSDPSTLRKFKRRKASDQTFQTSSVQATKAIPDFRTHPAQHILSPEMPAPAASSVSVPQTLPAFSPLASSITVPSTRLPKSSNASSLTALPTPPRKKRTKRQGLQAMLQARKDSEESQQQARLSSSNELALASFLKTL